MPVPLGDPISLKRSESVPYEDFADREADSQSGDVLMSEIRINGTVQEKRALYEIKDYMTKYPELRTGTAIFVFEGLATPAPTDGDKNKAEDEFNWNGINKSHPNGQFGAIVIVTKDGKLTYALMKDFGERVCKVWKAGRIYNTKYG